MRLEGRVALVTGAASGIGRAVAEPEDMVNAALFLCTADSAAFYGSVLVADEGLIASIPPL